MGFEVIKKGVKKEGGELSWGWGVQNANANAMNE